MSIPLVILLIAVAAGVVIWLRPTDSSGGKLIDATRVVISAPAYFVPALMTLAAVGLVVAIGGLESAGANPWLGGSSRSVFVQGLLVLCVSIGLAGHIGLLEARRNGASPGPDAFLAGIRQHTWTFFVAKLALAGSVTLIANSWLPYYFGSFASETLWLCLIPSYLFAPVIGAATLHPGQPIRALFRGLAITSARPWRVLTTFGLQCGLTIFAASAMQANMHHRLHLDFVLAEAARNGSSLGFQQFPFASMCFDEPALIAILAMTALSPVFLTSYWSIANGPLSHRSRISERATAA